MLHFVKNSDAQENALRCHRALSNFNRLSMISIIASANKNDVFINANILADSMDIAQGLCSHHLSILKKANLVRVVEVKIETYMHKALYVDHNTFSQFIKDIQNIHGER